MLDIKSITTEIISALQPLEPEKVILFGSYAYGTPTEESDIDILIIKDSEKKKVRELRLEARKMLRSIIAKNHVGIDIVLDSSERITDRIKLIKDQFYEEVMTKGKVIYGK